MRGRLELDDDVDATSLGTQPVSHIRIPPYTPRWNGKIERFFGTLEDEWAHGR
ncbi:MAG: family transposase, partial [Solirubrobacterales bacterium]|nr:family transposase [Solirubrobacterales bacterium]